MELSADWVVPVDGSPVENGLVAWEDGRIVDVRSGRAARHHADAVILPGFVNAHSHLEYAVYAGFGDGMPFAAWLRTHMTRKRALTFDDALAIARRGAADSLASGITTTADYSFSGAAAVAAHELGLRAIVYLEVFAASPAEAERQLEQTRSRIPRDLLGIPVGTHLAESANENEWLEHGTGPLAAIRDLLVPPPGKRAVAALEDVLGPELLCAHCVEVEPHEIALLADRDVPVAHCPRSNALLGCGIAPLAAFRDAGLRVGLGTDSPASTPSFDAFEELRAAVYAARARERRPDALTAEAAMRLATLDAARALRHDDEVGTLTPGKRADLTVVSLAGSPYHPVEDPVTAVVFGGSPDRVLEAIVDGHTRYSRGETEWQEVHSTASAARRRMLAPPTP